MRRRVAARMASAWCSVRCVKISASPVSRVAGRSRSVIGAPALKAHRCFWSAVNLKSSRADSVQPAPALAGEYRRHQDGYFAPEQRRALFERIRDSGAKIVTVAMGSPRQEILCATVGVCTRTRCMRGRRRHYDVSPGTCIGRQFCRGGSGAGMVHRLLLQPSRIKRQFRLLRYLRWHYSGKL